MRFGQQLIDLEACEILSEVSIDYHSFKVTLSPVHEGCCILWFKDERVSARFKALGRFSYFDKARVLHFVVRYTVDPELRDDIEQRKFESRLDNLPSLYFEHFEQLGAQAREHAYRDMFDLDGVIDKRDLARRRRIMAKKFHPDRGGSQEAMRVINQAYEFLLPTAIGFE